MSTKNGKSNKLIKNIAVASLVSLLSAFTFAATPNAGDGNTGSPETRTSESLHFVTGGRSNDRDPSRGEVSVDEYAALNAGTSSGQTATKSSGSSNGGSVAESGSFDFWFYDADVDLFYDDDRDGFFHGIDLLFDVDTSFVAADVYAAVYLSYNGGPWNEYAVTEDFTIFGSSGTDEYVLVSELMSGYPTGDYDLLIELFDAYDGTFLTSFGPEDTSELSYLPLEDFSRDAPVVETRVIVTEGGGGAFGIWMLIGLLIVRRGFH